MSQKNKKDSRSEQGGEIMGNTYSAKDMGQEQHQPVVCYLVSILPLLGLVVSIKTAITMLTAVFL